MLNLEEQEDFKRTYKNYRAGSVRLSEHPDVSHVLSELIRILDPSDIHFLKTCLSDYFYYEYIKGIIELGQQTIKKVKKEIVFLDKVDKAILEFQISNLEHLLKATETSPSFMQLERKENYKDNLWFRIGLLFAKGIAQDTYKKKFKGKKGEFKLITLELGFKESDRPYFSDTIGGNSSRPQNIYSNKKYMTILFDYCTKNEIEMCSDFESAYNKISTD